MMIKLISMAISSPFVQASLKLCKLITGRNPTSFAQPKALFIKHTHTHTHCTDMQINNRVKALSSYLLASLSTVFKYE